MSQSKQQTPFFKADAKPLAQTLAKVLPAVQRRSKAPILTHALLSTKDGRLTVSGTNLDLQIDATVGVEQLGEPASVAVDPRTLHQLLRSLSGEVVALALEDTDLVVTWSDGRASLGILPAADFPAFEAVGAPYGAALPPTFVSEVLDPVRHCISTEETRYYLNGVVTDRDPAGRAVACATDGHRLRVAPAPALAEALAAMGDPRPIIRREFVSLWRAAAFAKESLITFYKKGNGAPYVAIETDSLKITGKTIDGSFPAWPKVVPEKAESRAVFQKAALLMALQRLAIVSRSPKDHAHVFITCEAGRATLATRNLRFGQIEHTVTCEGGFEHTVGFNARYLLDAVERARGGVVTIAGDAEAAPFRITGCDDPDGSAMVLMAIRTDAVVITQKKRAA